MESKNWSGPCIGGPMNAMDGASRFPKGMLVVDRPGNRVWVYDYIPLGESPTGGAFQVRTEEGAELVDDWSQPKNRVRAAMEAEFEVRSLPWISPKDGS
jgi:hypothetical protein